MSFSLASGKYLQASVGIPTSHQNFSACGWFKRGSDSGASEYLLHFGTGTNPIKVRITDADLLRLNLQDSTSRYATGPTVAVGTPIFVGISIGTTATLYWRAEGEASLNSATAVNSGGTWTTDNFYAGRDATVAPSNPYTGLAACLRRWNGQLSAVEMMAESSSLTAVKSTGILSDHRGDGANIAAALVDDSAAGNDLTEVGGVTVDAWEPTVTVGGSTHAMSGGDDLPVITSVDLAPTAPALYVGDDEDLTVTVKDQGAVGIAYLTGTPASDDTAVATVSQLAATDADGKASVRLVAVAPGTASITFTIDGVASNAVSVTVSEQPVSNPLQVFPSTVSLDAGATQQFAATIGGEDATVTWTIPSGGGLIDGDGLYTAPASAGTATVRGTLVADSSIYAEATVTISASTAATATAAWPSAAGLSLDYWVFNKSDGLIASGTKTADADGSISVSVPSTYVGELVNVAVNNLDSSMSTAGKIQAQKVVTVV